MPKNTKKELPQEVYGKGFVAKKGRTLPIYKCFISETRGLVTLIIVRKLPNRNFVTANFLIDSYCLGLKNTDTQIDLTAAEYEVYFDRLSENIGHFQECTYATLHNWVYGGIAYAEEIGFKPHPDFNLSRYLLEEDTEDVELIEFEFGRDGQPLFIEGPYDNSKRIIDTLIKNVGEGNFNYMGAIG
jgi:hypothetical protein